jgi:hypothetical protein
MALVRIVNVRPVHRAMNEAAAQVGTDFFLQLDADMILNDWCVEELRAAMEDEVGMTVGSLWDPLMGVEAGIKLFRTESVRRMRFRDTISPDVDFYQRLPAYGWRAAFVLPSPRPQSPDTPWPTFGRHLPDYSPAYTYARYHLIGVRYRRRRDFPALRWRYERLRGSTHALGLLARIALSAGVLCKDGDGDEMAQDRIVDQAAWVHAFLAAPAGPARGLREPIPSGRNWETFTRWHDTGVECRNSMDAPTFLRRLDDADHGAQPALWYARLGLCHGLVFGACRPERLRATFQVIGDLLSGPLQAGGGC